MKLLSYFVLKLLPDETFESVWVKHEVQTARDNDIDIIAIIDTDEFIERNLIDKSTGLGFGYSKKQ